MNKATLIIAYYNKIDYLRLVLAGFEIQSENNFELIIADDGSSNKRVDELMSIIKASTLNIKHIWQEDRGFRKNKILNKAIKHSKSEYLIFIDGDCIPHPKFIEEHLANKQKNFALSGRRAHLSQHFTSLLTSERVLNGFIQKQMSKLFLDGITGKSTYFERSFYIKNKFFRNIINSKPIGLLGSNFSLYKNDILDINGFDERFEAPSVGEDSELQYRLELNGTIIKPIKNIAVQYHLYHTPLKHPEKNVSLFNEIKKSKMSYTPHGIVKTKH